MQVAGILGEKKFEIRLMTVEALDKLVVYEEAQRKLDKAHARRISDYARAGLYGEIDNVFFSPIVANQRADGTISVNDGQHRKNGLVNEFERLISESMKLRNKLTKKDLSPDQIQEINNEKSMIDYALGKLKAWQIPVMVYLGLTVEEERQLFHDINNNAKKPPKSLSLEFDTANLYTRLVKEAVQELDQFEDKIEWGQKLAEQGKMLFSSVHASAIKFLGKKRTDAISTSNFDDKKELVKKFFTIYFESLPKDYEDEKYIFSLAPTLQGIATFGNHLLVLSSEKKVDWERVLRDTLSGFDFKHTNPLFVSLGKLTVTDEGKLATRGTGGTIKAIFETLKGVAQYYDYAGKQVFPYDVDTSSGDGDELNAEETAIDESVVEEAVEEQATGKGKAGKGKGGKGKDKDNTNPPADQNPSDAKPESTPASDDPLAEFGA